MTLHFQLREIQQKLNSRIFKQLLGPMAGDHRILQKKTHNNTQTQTAGLQLLICERRRPRRYLQTLNQKKKTQVQLVTLGNRE